MDFFSNPDIYDLDYDARHIDADFYLKECKKTKGEVLELGSGTGRISIPLIEAGIKLTCIDNSYEMIKKARLKNQNLNIIEANFSEFKLNKKFDAIIMPFNSFQHLYTNEEAFKFLENLKNHLNKNAVFIFDINNPDPFELNRKASEAVVYDVYKAYFQNGVLKRYLNDTKVEAELVDIIVEDTLDYNPITQLSNYKMYYSCEGKEVFFIAELKHRMFFPDEIDCLIKKAKFQIINKYGSFNKSSFSEDSEQQIFICSVK